MPVKARCVFETRPARWSGAVAVRDERSHLTRQMSQGEILISTSEPNSTSYILPLTFKWRTQEGMLPLRVAAHDPFSKRS